MPALAVKEKTASRQKTSVAAIRVIAVVHLVADLHQEKVAANDELASGQSLYAYVENNPLRWVDPDGLTGRAPGHAPPYNRAPGVGLPSIPVHNMLVCIQSCLGVPFTITSTYRPGPGQGEHGTGGAADARYRGPGTGPFSSGNFLCCAARCGAGYGLDEYDHPSPGATAPHLHIQRAPGRNGGRGDLPLPGCEPNQCGK